MVLKIWLVIDNQFILLTQESLVKQVHTQTEMKKVSRSIVGSNHQAAGDQISCITIKFH